MQVKAKEVKEELPIETAKSQWTWPKEGMKLFQDRAKERLTEAEKEICRELIYQSIPCHLRGKVWMIASGAKEQMLAHPNYYKDLLKVSRQIPSFYQKNIELDIPRTLEGSCEGSEATLEHLKNILICYSIRNSSVGYCQGFNFIVDKLYQIANDEEEAFWLFCQIVEDILPLNYYSELIGIMTDSAIVYGLIKIFFPNLHQYFVQNEFEANVTNFINKWLISLFTRSFKEETVDFILDMLFLEGNYIVIQSALSIFFLLEKCIINTEGNIQSLFQILNYKNNIITPMLLYPFFKNGIFKFPNEHLRQLRSEVLPNIIQRFSIIPHKTLVEMKVEFSGKCNKKFPYCLGVSSIEVQNEGIESLVYSRGQQLAILPNYFDNFIKNSEEMDSVREDESCFDVLLERRQHGCESYPIERCFSLDYGLLSKNSSFNIQSARSVKAMKFSERQTIINNRLSKLHLIADEMFDGVFMKKAIQPFANFNQTMFVNGNETLHK